MSTAEAAERVLQAARPELVLPSGKVVPVEHIKARQVIEYLRLAAVAADDGSDMIARLLAFADLMQRFSEDIAEPELLELEMPEFMEMFGRFFGIMVRSLGGMNKLPTDLTSPSTSSSH